MLTKFNGIHFGDKETYSYERAKWYLNAFVTELKKHPDVRKIYPRANIETKGRGAITGKTLELVWDCITLCDKNENFSKQPHLTFVIQPDWTHIQITLPHNAKPMYWQTLTSCGKEELKELFLTMHNLLRKGQPKNSTVKLMVEVLHRHYRSRNDVGVIDGKMNFNVDCLLDQGKIDTKVKTFFAWLDALSSVLEDRKEVNLQIAVYVRYDHAKGSIVSKPEFVEETIRALKALKPFYDKIES